MYYLGGGSVYVYPEGGTSTPDLDLDQDQWGGRGGASTPSDPPLARVRAPYESRAGVSTRRPPAVTPLTPQGGRVVDRVRGKTIGAAVRVDNR